MEVFLAHWEIECCRPPPGLGDRFGWPLRWVDDPSGPGAREVAWRVSPLLGGTDLGLLLRHDRLTAWWPESDVDVPVRGALVADGHGQVPEQVPVTDGRVVRVQVVEQAYRLVPPRTYEPVDGDFSLRPVERSPRWFDTGSAEPPLPPSSRWESGVLVGLRLGP